jgi:hypothetical protein
MLNATAYTVHYHMQSSQAGGLRAVGIEWTASGLWAAGRGRLDIRHGDEVGVMRAGTYYLFDGSDATVVDPSDGGFHG